MSKDDGFATTLVPLDKIKPPLFQCRTASLDENLEELVESIKTVGLLEPLIIRLDSEHQPELVIGSRRKKACEKAGLTMVPVVIRYLTDEEALEIEGVENLHRNDLSSEEKTRLCVEWARRGYKATDIPKKVHKSYSWVLEFLPDEYKDQVKSQAGVKGGEARAATIVVAKSQDSRQGLPTVTPSSTTQDIEEEKVACERDGVYVPKSDIHVWHGHSLCTFHFEAAKRNEVGYLGFFRTREQEAKINHQQRVVELKPSDFYSYAEKQARMQVPHSAMENKIVAKLRAKGYKVQTGIRIVVSKIETEPDFNIELSSGKLVHGYVDGVVHNGKQKDKDEDLRGLLRKAEPSSLIVEVDVKGDSDKEADEKVNEIIEAMKW